ncbi:MAG TPA: hypothetical protein VMA30_20080 [Xanthobacteraceae bacterium]|nr:hypothetical protein [Xanthobacteraceae bacterium]
MSNSMSSKSPSKFVLPYEPQYTRHREAEKQQQDARDWLRRRERETTSPAIVPELAPDHEREDQKAK